MNNISKLIDTLRSRNMFAQYYESGGSPTEIKTHIVNTLRPFFVNQLNLEKHAINFLVPDYVNFNQVIVKYSSIDQDIRLVLDTYNTALYKDREELFRVIKQLVPDIIESGNRYWTFLNLEKDKGNLELYEFAKESFDNLHDIIEGIMKSHLIEQVIVNRLVRGKPFNVHTLKTRKLGVHVDELITHTHYSHLFRTQPESLTLSEWRNIAAHQSYSIVGDTIVCQYGTPQMQKSISLTRDELYDRLSQIARTLEVINLSHKFFCFDNYDEISLESDTQNSGSAARDEIWLLFFVTGLNSLGFEVVQFQFEKHGNAMLVVKDMTEGNPKWRAIHSSQFIYPVWVFTGSDNIAVEYRLNNDTRYVVSRSTSDVCMLVSEGQRDIEYFAENVVFEFVGDNQKTVTPDQI